MRPWLGSAVLVAAALLVGLVPVETGAPNRVAFGREGGVALVPPSQLVAEAPLAPFDGDFTLTLSVVLEPSEERGNRPIVTLLH